MSLKFAIFQFLHATNHFHFWAVFQLMSWLKEHPPVTQSFTWDDLNGRANSFEEFMKQYDILREKTKTIKKGIKTILASKN